MMLLQAMQKALPDLAAALRILEKQGWYSQRSRETRAFLGAIAKLRRFAKDDAVYLAGDAPNGVFGLVSGSLNISYPRADGEDYTVHRAGSGFWIGDAAMFAKGTRLVSIRAAEPTTMVQLPLRDLTQLLRDEARLYADFYALSYENFRMTLQIITNLAIPSAEKRIADRLILEANARGDAEGWIALSQPELAKLVAVSLPTLQRVMRRFAQAGLVQRSYARLQVLDRDGLVQICKA
jgi:CRP/FNR family transcriptional regulator, cyclic AMP receptor protein